MENSALIASVPRTEGDGMESFDNQVAQDFKRTSVTSAASAFEALSLKSSPQTVERVISLVPTSSPLSVKSKSSASSENKKLKFVPYEPYKAAVKPIVPLKSKVMKKPNNQTPAPLEHKNEVDEEEHCRHLQHLTEVQAHLEQTLKEKAELESQLKIQSKVNEELKKLLVASVGEDMEARVHFLTEDKIKLSDDIRQYVEKIANDFEQKEKLSIEADIWRSKFLASSVVIEELTKWKSVLCKRNDDLQICIKALASEMNTISCNQQHTQQHIKALHRAFDPLGNSCQKSPEPIVSDAVEKSSLMLQLAEQLSKRLLGTYTQIREDGATCVHPPIEKLTPAQMAAKEVLTSQPVGSCSMSELASDVTAKHVAALARRSVNKSFFSCCPHCTGEVHII